MPPRNCRTRVLWASCLAAGFCTVAFAAPADDLRALVESGASAAAYARCTQLDTQADPDLDLWCGVAAVDVGREATGVLALERYVLTHPDDIRGRLELA